MTAKEYSGDRKRSRPVTKRSKLEIFKKNKYISVFIIIIVVIVAISGAYVLISDDDDSETIEENPIAVIDTSMGTIKVELYKDKAPNTVKNFVKLANDGFYDGLVFHRVANLDSTAPDTHVVQGGGFSPDGTEKESPYGEIALEINDELSHTDGAIAMARTSEPNSATNQFYICDGEHTYLDDSYRQEYMGDRGYAVFGYVTEGMEVVRSIASVQTTTKFTNYDNWPVEDVIINSIIIE